MPDDGTGLQDVGATAWIEPPGISAPHRSGRRWLLLGALALAFALTLGAGALLGANYLATAQAASLAPPNAQPARTLLDAQGAQGAQGQCGVLTVSSISGQTITAKASNGSTVTIHTTTSTQYTRAGQPASASAVAAGAQIHVDGTHNSDGSITATRIDVR